VIGGADTVMWISPAGRCFSCVSRRCFSAGVSMWISLRFSAAPATWRLRRRTRLGRAEADGGRRRMRAGRRVGTLTAPIHPVVSRSF
jgi:hypothetical protein